MRAFSTIRRTLFVALIAASVSAVGAPPADAACNWQQCSRSGQTMMNTWSGAATFQGIGMLVEECARCQSSVYSWRPTVTGGYETLRQHTGQYVYVDPSTFPGYSWILVSDEEGWLLASHQQVAAIQWYKF